MLWLEINIWGSFTGYANYLWSSITNPTWNNYFYYLIFVSAVVWTLEILIPWRKGQKPIRKDFWQDAFYMFFNFFLFYLIGYNALSNLGVELFDQFLGLFGLSNKPAIEISSWPIAARYALLIILADFIQWSVHVMLHRVPWLWKFHKVHHSVTQMGFAAHLRYHFMETIVYNSIKYIPLTMIGFDLHDLFYLHATTILIGHLNHANINVNYGPLKYLLNNPRMHLWHHAKELPENHPYGVNFGISLSIWDYLFKTAYQPKNDPELELGFEGIENYPESFIEQVKAPFKKDEATN